MHHPESTIAALFDHEQDPSPLGERERGREAPDWGGDELFSSMPRRRIRGERARRRETSEHPLPRPSSRAVAPSVPRRAAVHQHALDAQVEPPAATEGDVVAEPEVDLLGPPPERAPSGRRTVTVTGHPDRARTARPLGDTARRRPSPTVDQRLGSRPDRIAGWAFALGLLLIFIAYATAQAGT